ncbi:MAG: TrkA C-terminal domain-containing protein [Lachnospiraceae bacterium]|nr:TrkA C-terminal domain-containing protein [Lachnospiraceae bacterium]
MNFQLSVVFILVILVIYMVLINIFSIVLRISGVPADIANFQGISLFTNCGYTTGESESIATSKIRRKIALICMITGNIFSVIIVSLIVNIFASFNKQEAQDAYVFAAVSIGLFAGVVAISQIPFVKKKYSDFIQRIIDDRIQKNNKDNFMTIVEHFAGKEVVEIYIHWIPEILYNKTIHESKIKNTYGINILSIMRDKKNIEISRNTRVQKNDKLLVYGDYHVVKDVFSILKEREEIEEKYRSEHKKSFNEIDLIDNYGLNSLVEVKIEKLPEFLSGKSLENSRLKEKFDINVMALKRDNESVDITKDTEILDNDILIVFGPFKAIKNIFIYEYLLDS